MSTDIHTPRDSIGYVGFGEIGSAVHEIVSQGFPESTHVISDPGKGYPFNRGSLVSCTVLHVSIPYTNHFHTIVSQYLTLLKEKSLVITHSTLPVGTTRRLQSAFPSLDITHSPVRGVHPHLASSLRTFAKVVGGTSTKATERAVAHLTTAGMPAKAYTSCESTEMMKLLSTTYYAKCITFYKDCNKLLQRINADHPEYQLSINEVLQESTRDYNEGYAQMDMPHVSRPVLETNDNPIGGHCLGPNACLLWKDYKFEGVRDIMKYIYEEHQFILHDDDEKEDAASANTCLIIPKK